MGVFVVWILLKFPKTAEEVVPLSSGSRGGIWDIDRKSMTCLLLSNNQPNNENGG